MSESMAAALAEEGLSKRASETNLILRNQSRIMRPEQMQASMKGQLSVALPSLGGKRRVHEDGILMLDKHFNMREAEKKFEVMENRLKRLQDEEARAQRN